MSPLTEETLRMLVDNILFYYKETKHRLPTKKEFLETYSDACLDLTVLGCAKIPRFPEPIEPTITDLLREMDKDPLIRRVIEAKSELLNPPETKKKLSRKKRRKRL